MKCLFDRAEKLGTTEEDMLNEKQHLSNVLKGMITLGLLFAVQLHIILRRRKQLILMKLELSYHIQKA